MWEEKGPIFAMVGIVNPRECEASPTERRGGASTFIACYTVS